MRDTRLPLFVSAIVYRTVVLTGVNEKGAPTQLPVRLLLERNQVIMRLVQIEPSQEAEVKPLGGGDLLISCLICR